MHCRLASLSCQTGQSVLLRSYYAEGQPQQLDDLTNKTPRAMPLMLLLLPQLLLS